MIAHPMSWQEEEPPASPVLCGLGETALIIDMPNGYSDQRRVLASIDPDSPDAAPVAAALRAIAAALDAGTETTLGLTELTEAERSLLLDTLGRGEVSAELTGLGRYHVAETGLTGVWRVARLAVDSGAGAEAPVEHIEVATIPTVVRAAADHGTLTKLVLPAEVPPGTMNAMPVLAEVQTRMMEWQHGQPNHVISLSLLPMSDPDMALLKQVLGLGPVEIVSRGYGDCRVTATAHRHVWSVQFTNASDKVILDTIEIGTVPRAALAAPEDFADSARHLRRVLDAYFV